MGPDNLSGARGASSERFQSTGPVWDPTRRTLDLRPKHGISIHGSRVGPDLTAWAAWRRKAHFNPRVPCGTRLATAVGAMVGYDISIHGSRVGPDEDKHIAEYSEKNFNPRVPCGTRHFLTLTILIFGHFNPRVPCGTRPLIFETVVGFIISIHGSRVGPDLLFWVLLFLYAIFQSTGPVWDPTCKHIKLTRDLEISIHGSRVGPDPGLP